MVLLGREPSRRWQTCKLAVTGGGRHDDQDSREKVYDAICRSLQEFGYPSVSPQMISEIHARQKYHDGMLKILRAMGASPAGSGSGTSLMRPDPRGAQVVYALAAHDVDANGTSARRLLDRDDVR
jgi:hypothetical protein